MADTAKSRERRKTEYHRITENFTPVFRHFFRERFASAAEWLERRTAYTRSVATSSIVGYMLGIGDRHTQNVLVQQHTAEIVHIDFGFMLSNSPGGNMGFETSPFKLTQEFLDIMDGEQSEQ